MPAYSTIKKYQKVGLIVKIRKPMWELGPKEYGVVFDWNDKLLWVGYVPDYIISTNNTGTINLDFNGAWDSREWNFLPSQIQNITTSKKEMDKFNQWLMARNILSI